MTQTWAIFYDAYRSLNAKKMFWIVLALSVLVVVAFAMVGINAKGVKILGWQIDNLMLNTEIITPAYFYKTMFVTFGISIWLAWLATILALISTAGIFPDLISSGSIDLVVSKPIGRGRLFLLQYAAGLLFVTLQVTLFSAASFLVIGLRGGAWEPGLFLAVPLVVCLFSYLFAVCVFLGIVTRSTVASLLLTLLLWFAVWGVSVTEGIVLQRRTMEKHDISMADLQTEQRGGWRRAPAKDAEKGELQDDGGKKKDDTGNKDDDAKKDESSSLEVVLDVVYGVKTVLPKTGETVKLLERSLITTAELDEQLARQGPKQRKLSMEIEETFRARSIAWVLGTSLGFELFFVAWAAWIFCRRDF